MANGLLTLNILSHELTPLKNDDLQHIAGCRRRRYRKHITLPCFTAFEFYFSVWDHGGKYRRMPDHWIVMGIIYTTRG